jgi:hypothetical protein
LSGRLEPLSLSGRSTTIDESELLEGEVTVFDEGGGVLVHLHGDERVGVAEPLGDGRNRHVLGEEPDGVGVAQIADAQATVVGPRLGRVERTGGRVSIRGRSCRSKEDGILTIQAIGRPFSCSGGPMVWLGAGGAVASVARRSCGTGFLMSS